MSGVTNQTGAINDGSQSSRAAALVGRYGRSAGGAKQGDTGRTGKGWWPPMAEDRGLCRGLFPVLYLVRVQRTRIGALRYPGVAGGSPHRSKRIGERLECGVGLGAPNPGPALERFGGGRTEDVEVAAREFKTGVARVHGGRRQGPDGRLAGAVPTQQDRASGSGITETVMRHAERLPSLTEGHSPAVDEGAETRGCLVCPCQAACILRQPPEREFREVFRGHYVNAESRAPQLEERRVLPASRAGAFDSRMDRQESGAWHGVLQPGPGRPAE